MNKAKIFYITVPINKAGKIKVVWDNDPASDHYYCGKWRAFAQVAYLTRQQAARLFRYLRTQRPYRKSIAGMGDVNEFHFFTHNALFHW